MGPTGAGKTTLINLLMRFYDPDSGAIYFGRPGHPEDHPEEPASVLRHGAAGHLVVLRAPSLKTWPTAKRMPSWRTCSGLPRPPTSTGTSCGLPKGYDTQLDENGMNISQGQKQLLTIARAMLLDAKMLILDEATSNVDTRTEHPDPGGHAGADEG